MKDKTKKELTAYLIAQYENVNKADATEAIRRINLPECDPYSTLDSLLCVIKQEQGTIIERAPRPLFTTSK